jgi:NAD(P)H-flavin reductase
VLLVATGTGIAPLRAMLQHLARQRFARAVDLLFGVRSEAELLYGDELRGLCAGLDRYRFSPTLSRPGQSWPGRRGRVQAHVEELLDGRTQIDVYLCGQSEMVRSVSAQLEALGVDPTSIHFERYG